MACIMLIFILFIIIISGLIKAYITEIFKANIIYKLFTTYIISVC